MRRTDKGAALIIAMVMVALVAGLVVMLFNGALAHTQTVDTARAAAESRAVAQAGLDITVARINDFPAAIDLTIDERNTRLAATTLGGLNTGVGTAGINAFTGSSADLGAFDRFGAGFVATEISATAPVTASGVTTRWVTVRATGVGGDRQGRSAVEAIFKEETTTQTQPLQPGDHLLAGGVSVGTAGTIPHNVRYGVDSGGTVSGYDHDIEGTNPSTDGVAAISLSSEAGRALEVHPDGSSDATIVGPGGVNGIENAADDSLMIPAMTSVANSVISDPNATHFVAGADPSNDRWVLSGGQIGTPQQPAVIHVDARNYDIDGAPVVEITSGAKGYGVILVTLKQGSQINGPVVKVDAGDGGWHGYILIDTGNGTKISDHWIVEVGNNSKVVGGVGLLHRVALSNENPGVGTSFEHQTGYTLKVASSGQILYSSAAIAAALNATGAVTGTSLPTTTYELKADFVRVQ